MLGIPLETDMSNFESKPLYLGALLPGVAEWRIWPADISETALRDLYAAFKFEMEQRGLLVVPVPVPKPFELETDEKALIRGGAMIPAIKMVRARSAVAGRTLALKEAKDIVDAYRNQYVASGGKIAQEMPDPPMKPSTNNDRW